MCKENAALSQIIFNIEHIGSPHSVVLKLIEKSNNPDFGIDEIASDIAQDATVSALILKTANSAYFARGQRFNTIKQAVIHLGTENIKKLLFAVEMIGIFKGHCASESFSEVNFWRNTLAGAILASKYAGLRTIVNPDIAYLAALLRNIGVLAIRQFVPVEFEILLDVQEKETLPFKTVSRSFLGISHREIAYMIGLRWSLPRIIIESLRDNLNPHEMNNEIIAVRDSIFFADDLLHITKYSIWDTFYMPGKTDFHGIPCEEMLSDATSLVDNMMKEFWI